MKLHQVCVELLSLKEALDYLLIPEWYRHLCSDKIPQPEFHGQVQVAKTGIDV